MTFLWEQVQFYFIFIIIFFLLFDLMTRLFVPWPGIERRPPAVEAWSLNCWTLGSPRPCVILKIFFICKNTDPSTPTPWGNCETWKGRIIERKQPLPKSLYEPRYISFLSSFLQILICIRAKSSLKFKHFGVRHLFNLSQFLQSPGKYLTHWILLK